ncbi:MAG: hypothetical protein HY323_05310 [Betaproteobacteria bacterium]|nr:hypothetical protein [Betaproteobacteria bacterium]
MSAEQVERERDEARRERDEARQFMSDRESYLERNLENAEAALAESRKRQEALREALDRITKAHAPAAHLQAIARAALSADEESGDG